MMVDAAQLHPEIKFLAYTKRRDILDNKETLIHVPKNLKLFFSQWQGLEETNNGFSRTWFKPKDRTETRIPKNAIKCPGGAGKNAKKCIDCLICWNIKAGRDVYFPEH